MSSTDEVNAIAYTLRSYDLPLFKIIDISQKNSLREFLLNLRSQHLANQKMGSCYFACPLTLVHLARALAAVTHSMTE